MNIPDWKKHQKKFILGGIAICVFLLLTGGKPEEKKEEALLQTAKEPYAEKRMSLAETLEQGMLNLCMPLFCFSEKEEFSEKRGILETVLLDILPIFLYEKEATGGIQKEDNATWELLMAVREENGQGAEGQTEEEEGVEEALTLEEMLALENQQAKEAPGEEDSTVSQNEEALPVAAEGFIPHEKQFAYDWSQYPDYEALLSAFYAVDSTTMIGSDQINSESLMKPDVTISKEAPGPQILIYHTHSQEDFADSVPGDSSTTIMGAGEKLANVLTNQYGYSVLHHTGEYDVESRDDAYAKSLPAIEQVLSDNPNIQVVIDLHRDEVKEDRKLVVDVDGRPTAQFMFFNGLSRTKKTGNLDYLENPYQAENLAFSFKMQVASNEFYPGITRRIYLKGYRYNMHLKPRTLLIELGAQTNTVEEIMNAIDPLAHILSLVLSGEAGS